MKSRLFLILFAILTCYSVYSQDTIVHINGQRIICVIQREDSTHVYYSLTKDGREINAFLNKDNIASIRQGPEPVLKTEQQLPFIPEDRTSFGIGFGLDHGGIGANLLLYPQRNIGLFGGFGYAIAGVGYNGGVKIRLITENRKSLSAVYLTGMYGYNAAIAVANAPRLNKIFYGPTFGFGFDLRGRRAKRNYWTLSLLIPVRGAEVNDYMDNLKINQGVEFKNDLLPLAFSIGYRIVIN